jgi:hypothetical protein
MSKQGYSKFVSPQASATRVCLRACAFSSHKETFIRLVLQIKRHNVTKLFQVGNIIMNFNAVFTNRWQAVVRGILHFTIAKILFHNLCTTVALVDEPHRMSKVM